MADGAVLAGSRRTVVKVDLTVGAGEAVHACALVPIHLVLVITRNAIGWEPKYVQYTPDNGVLLSPTECFFFFKAEMQSFKKTPS